LTCLIVDDNSLFLKRVADLLRREGLASSGADLVMFALANGLIGPNAL
jgi:hypothetical protein